MIFSNNVLLMLLPAHRDARAGPDRCLSASFQDSPSARPPRSSLDHKCADELAPLDSKTVPKKRDDIIAQRLALRSPPSRSCEMPHAGLQSAKSEESRR